MTNYELSKVLFEAYELARSSGWTPSDEQTGWPLERVRQRWLETAERVRDEVESSQREQTAATILAALIPAAIVANPHQPIEGLVTRAVALTDALRAALEAP